MSGWTLVTQGFNILVIKIVVYYRGESETQGEEGIRCRSYGDYNASYAIKSPGTIDSIRAIIPAKNSGVLFPVVDSWITGQPALSIQSLESEGITLALSTPVTLSIGCLSVTGWMDRNRKEGKRFLHFHIYWRQAELFSHQMFCIWRIGINIRHDINKKKNPTRYNTQKCS